MKIPEFANGCDTEVFLHEKYVMITNNYQVLLLETDIIEGEIPDQGDPNENEKWEDRGKIPVGSGKNRGETTLKKLSEHQQHPRLSLNLAKLKQLVQPTKELVALLDEAVVRETIIIGGMPYNQRSLWAYLHFLPGETIRFSVMGHCCKWGVDVAGKPALPLLLEGPGWKLLQNYLILYGEELKRSLSQPDILAQLA